MALVHQCQHKNHHIISVSSKGEGRKASEARQCYMGTGPLNNAPCICPRPSTDYIQHPWAVVWCQFHVRVTSGKHQRSRALQPSSPSAGIYSAGIQRSIVKANLAGGRFRVNEHSLLGWAFPSCQHLGMSNPVMVTPTNHGEMFQGLTLIYTCWSSYSSYRCYCDVSSKGQELGTPENPSMQGSSPLMPLKQNPRNIFLTTSDKRQK